MSDRPWPIAPLPSFERAACWAYGLLVAQGAAAKVAPLALSPKPCRAMTKSYERIYALVRQIPRGQVATYGQIAELAELYGQARLVGYALFRVVDGDAVPWHRVVNAKGQISESPYRNGSDDLQRVLLEAEGIVFRANGTIDLKRYRWHPSSITAEPPPVGL